MFKSKNFAAIIAIAAFASITVAGQAMAQSKGKDPLTNPRAVKHQIDRSAMSIQIQGWTRDLKYPVYPIEVQRGNPPYYTTNSTVRKYQEFDLNELACEIGKAPVEVLKDKKYMCADGVCFSNDAGAIIGVDPRKTVKRVAC